MAADMVTTAGSWGLQFSTGQEAERANHKEGEASNSQILQQATPPNSLHTANPTSCSLTASQGGVHIWTTPGQRHRDEWQPRDHGRWLCGQKDFLLWLWEPEFESPALTQKASVVLWAAVTPALWEGSISAGWPPDISSGIGFTTKEQGKHYWRCDQSLPPSASLPEWT